MSLKKVRRKPARLKAKRPSTLTVTYYRRLAAHCLAILDELAAVIPRLEETAPTRASRRYRNIPLAFLRTAIDSVEQIPQLKFMKKLDAHRGRGTLQLIEAFHPVRDRMAAFDCDLLNVIDGRRSSLAMEALDTYAVAKSLARDCNDAALLACVDRMQRDLGRRGRRKKT